jgi:hypothetical protein
MDAQQLVNAACDHKDYAVPVVALLIPVGASAAAWLNARYKKLPPSVQRILQGLALNFLHASLGEPTAQQEKPQ